MADVPQRLRESTPYLLTQATKAAARLAQPLFDGEALRFAHYVTLAWLAETSHASQRALGSAMGVDPSDLVTVLDELAEHGLVERSVDEADRRRRLLTVTAEGRRWLAARDRRAADYEALLRSRLPDDGAPLRAALLALAES